jgi:holo-[acyl-carrier protein] synthase
MIIGIGSDLVDIRRIESLIGRFGPRFLCRVFTLAERGHCLALARSGASFAKRFAAKEACAKALGTGLAGGVGWQDMEVVNGQNGAPALRLAGGAAARLADLVPAGLAAHVHVTLTDEYPLAHALVMISAESSRQSESIQCTQGRS